MTDQDAGIRRTRRALEDALAEAAEHPGYEAIEAYVDGTLDAVERARIESLAARSAEVAEDIADLDAVRRSIGEGKGPVDIRRNVRWFGVAAAAAAGLVAAVWIGTVRNQPGPGPTHPSSRNRPRCLLQSISRPRNDDWWKTL